MESWSLAMRRGMVAGAVASLLSTVALAWYGRRECGSAYAPVNAVSHWVWPEEALRHKEASLRYTGTGYLIHHLCSTFWGVLFERACGRVLERCALPVTLGTATAAAAVACTVDYRCTPRRLQPGYEEHLSKPALAAVYASFGLGLALGAILCRRR